jgi:hypothetical protein
LTVVGLSIKLPPLLTFYPVCMMVAERFKVISGD